MQNLNESLQAKYPHLELAILPLSQVNKDNESKRIDSEYFKKSNLKLLDDLYKYGTLQVQDIAIEVTDGIHTTIDYDTNSTINLISASSPQENYFTLTITNAFRQKCTQITQELRYKKMMLLYPPLAR
ncbi:hypothetical protein [Helicobacter fennelliae]|uniref:hypothetical protein n=1 Tax=Helicobacter fennelliae TaxID=215 RepID=UPI000E058FFB|nr:hypothetical protein [Helicobacter fennelliae]STQ85211.1 Uncharacterised protein [Helicobacter fennelliae]